MTPRFAMRSINSTIAIFLVLAIVFVGVTHMAGCANNGGGGSTTQPVNGGGLTFNDLVDLAQITVLLTTDAGSDKQKKLLAEIEAARLIGNSTAIRKIIDSLGGAQQAKASAQEGQQAAKAMRGTRPQ